MKSILIIFFLAYMAACQCDELKTKNRDLETQIIRHQAELDVMIEIYHKDAKGDTFRTIGESIGGLILAIVTALNVLNKKKGK